MDFKDVIIQLSERATKLKDSLSTEEATKTALLLPFINALGRKKKRAICKESITEICSY